MITTDLTFDQQACDAVAEEVNIRGNYGNYKIVIDAKTKDSKGFSWTISAYEINEHGYITGPYMCYMVRGEYGNPYDLKVMLFERGDLTPA